MAEDSFQRAAPHVWAKQWDNATRKLAVQLRLNGESYAVPSGTTATLRVRRHDGVLVTGSCTISGNTVTGTLTSQMLFVSGDAMAEIRLTSGSEILSTQPIILHVSPCAAGTAHQGWVSDTVNMVMLTQAQYSAISTKDTNTLYLCSDTGNAYIGTRAIGGGDSTPHVICTQAEYDAMPSHDESTIYIIRETV